MTNKNHFQAGICFIALFLALLLLPLRIAAEETAKIRFDTAEEEDGICKIPLVITENKGIMGYYVTISIQSETAVIKGAKRGGLTEKGVFDYKISDSGDAVDLLWAGTDEAAEDGILAYVMVADEEQFQKECKLSVSYSQPDTFDGTYQDVYLDCIEANLKQEKGAKAPTVTEGTEQSGKESDSGGAKQSGKESDSDGAKQFGKESDLDGKKQKNEKKEGVWTEPGADDDKESSQTEADSSTGAKSGLGDSGARAEEDTGKAQMDQGSMDSSEGGGRSTESESDYKTGDGELDSKAILISEKIEKDTEEGQHFYEKMGFLVSVGLLVLLTVCLMRRYYKNK